MQGTVSRGKYDKDHAWITSVYGSWNPEKLVIYLEGRSLVLRDKYLWNVVWELPVLLQLYCFSHMQNWRNYLHKFPRKTWSVPKHKINHQQTADKELFQKDELVITIQLILIFWTRWLRVSRTLRSELKKCFLNLQKMQFSRYHLKAFHQRSGANSTKSFINWAWTPWTISAPFHKRGCSERQWKVWRWQGK